MNHANKKISKRKALTLVLVVAAVLVAAILLRGCGQGPDVSTTEGRQDFLRELGWEIDAATEDIRTVQLPQTLEGTMAEYNAMQEKQGYDLKQHLGEQCQQVTYLVTNYPDDSQTVLVTLYIQGNRVIAGDIHSTALNGFLHGLKME